MMPAAEVGKNIKNAAAPIRNTSHRVRSGSCIFLLIHLYYFAITFVYITSFILFQILFCFRFYLVSDLFRFRILCFRFYSVSDFNSASDFILFQIPVYGSEIIYSSAGRSSAMLRSLSCTGSTTSGAPLMRSAASLFLGKAMTSRMLSAPVRSMTKRSTP